MTERNMQLEDWLDDLCVRFLMNGPKEDLETAERICFRIEEAQWYYEDFIRPLDPALPSMSLRRFCEQMFAHCPLLSPFSQGEHMQAFEAFLTYKARIPVRGAIMLNDTMDQVLLVKGWKKGAAWSFPRGKINKDEDDLDCAVREVYEETGFDLEAAGLVPHDRNVKFIELSMHEQQIRLFVFRDVPMSTHFEPRTRKEISKIMWWRISDLPAFKRKGQQQPAPAVKANNFYMVAPFLGPLRKWVLDQKKVNSRRVVSNPYLSAGLSHDDMFIEEDPGADSNGEVFTYAEAPRPVPDINSFAGANATINRFLNNPKHQEGTEALRGAPVPAKDSGSALLALLQSRPVALNTQAYQEPPPETPFDHSIEAPMPPTPHHEAPRPPQYASMPPPPNFALPSQEDDFSYDQPFLHNARRENMESKYLEAQQHIQRRQMARQQGNHHHYQPQHLIHPQPLPPHVQRTVFTGGAMHSNAVPQPLPPAAAHLYNPAVNAPAGITQFPGLHAPMVPEVLKQSPPKLTNHSLALLNAFKSRDGITGNNGIAEDVPARRFEQRHSPPEPHEPHIPQQEQHIQHPQRQAHHISPTSGRQQPQMMQQKPAVLQAPPPAPHQHPQTALQQPQVRYQQPEVPHRQIQAQYSQSLAQDSNNVYENQVPRDLHHQPQQEFSGASEAPEAIHPFKIPQNMHSEEGPSPSLFAAKQPPSEQQKSALLGLFKGLAPQVLPPKPASATALPTTPTPSAVELSAVEPLSSNAATTSALLNDKRVPQHTENERPIPQMNPEANLPFRAMAILSRPNELSNQVSQPVDEPPPKTASASSGDRVRSDLSSQPLSTNMPAFQPQILKRPPQSPPHIPEPPLTGHDFVPLPKPLPGFQASQPAEHKQNLLSLFSKAAPEPHTLQRASTIDSYTSAPSFEPSAPSRVNSLVSADAASRRGSQPPISSAHKGFLLNYLDAVAKGAQ